MWSFSTGNIFLTLQQLHLLGTHNVYSSRMESERSAARPRSPPGNRVQLGDIWKSHKRTPSVFLSRNLFSSLLSCMAFLQLCLQVARHVQKLPTDVCFFVVVVFSQTLPTWSQSLQKTVLICKPGWGPMFFGASGRQGLVAAASRVTRCLRRKHTRGYLCLKETPPSCSRAKQPHPFGVVIVCQTFGACTLRGSLIGRSKVQWAPTRLGLSAHLGSAGWEAGHRQECVRPGSTMSKGALSASLSSGSSAAAARWVQPKSLRH